MYPNGHQKKLNYTKSNEEITWMYVTKKKKKAQIREVLFFLKEVKDYKIIYEVMLCS